MSALLAFAGEHYWIFLISMLAGFTFVVTVLEVVWFRPFNRWCRHKNIEAKGWPPEHCDADGDYKEPTP